MRISEALNLRLEDVTEDGLVIRETKFQKSRLVPLHPTAVAVLQRYLDRRGIVEDDHVFISLRRRGIRYPGVITVFLRLVRAMGIRPGPGRPGPRIHDLRHGYAVRILETCPGDRTAMCSGTLCRVAAVSACRSIHSYWITAHKIS